MEANKIKEEIFKKFFHPVTEEDVRLKRSILDFADEYANQLLLEKESTLDIEEVNKIEFYLRDNLKDNLHKNWIIMTTMSNIRQWYSDAKRLSKLQSELSEKEKYFQERIEFLEEVISSNEESADSLSRMWHNELDKLRNELSELKEKRKDGEKIINFLRGIGDFDGVWFGDVPNGKPKYWWREELDKYYTQIYGQPTEQPKSDPRDMGLIQ